MNLCHYPNLRPELKAEHTRTYIFACRFSAGFNSGSDTHELSWKTISKIPKGKCACTAATEKRERGEEWKYAFIHRQNARDIQRLLTLQMNVLFLRTRSVQCSFTSFAWNLFHCEIILKSARKFSSSMRKSASFHFQSFVCSACFASCCSISMRAICMWEKASISIQWLFDGPLATTAPRLTSHNRPPTVWFPFFSDDASLARI